MNATDNVTACSQALEMDGYAIANIVLLFQLFVSLGMAVSFREIKHTLATPKGVLLIQAGHFLILPLVGWGMARGFALPPALAVGLVAVTTSPGGAISNIIAVLYQADIPLSVAATGVSSVIAIGMMPLNQYIYLIATQLAPTVCLNVTGIILTAVIVVLGSVVGLALIGILQPREMHRTIRVLHAIGSLSALAILIISFVANLNSSTPITQLPGKVVAACFLPFFIGTSFGLISATVVGLPRPSRVVVALEVGIQNKIVALSVLSFIFPVGSPARTASFAMPLLYAILATVLSFVWVGIAWKLGFTNMPKDKDFIEAFKIARAKAKEYRENELYGEAKVNAAIPVGSIVDMNAETILAEKTEVVA